MSGVTVVVTGLPASGKSTLARALADGLRLPCFSLDSVKEAMVDALPASVTRDRFAVRSAARNVLVRLVAEHPRGSVVDVWVNPTRDETELTAALAALPGAEFVELVCRVPVATSLERYAARTRHPAHLPLDADTERRIREAAPALRPLGLGPHLDVDTTTSVDLARVEGWPREHRVAT